MDVMPDGIRYFHVCPPIVDAKTRARTARPHARDENVVASGPHAGTMRAAGAGVLEAATAAELDQAIAAAATPGSTPTTAG